MSKLDGTSSPLCGETTMTLEEVRRLSPAAANVLENPEARELLNDTLGLVTELVAYGCQLFPAPFVASLLTTRIATVIAAHVEGAELEEVRAGMRDAIDACTMLDQGATPQEAHAELIRRKRERAAARARSA